MRRHGIEGKLASAKPLSGVWVTRAGAAALVLALTACSSLPDVPDYANPVEWYRSTTDMVGGWFKDEEAKVESASDTAKDAKSGAAKSEEKFPTLASVPEKPKPASSAEEREKLKNELASDRANARYTEEKPKGAVKVEAPAAKPAPVVATAPSVAAPPVVRSAPAPVAAPAPAPAPASQGESARGLARLPSQVYDGKRSSLWPNAPAPQSSSDVATTSARVSGSKITTSGTMNTPATSRIIAPAPAPALAPAPAAPMPEAGAKQSMNTEQGSAATQTAAAPVAPPAPEIPPRFTLTPPGSGGTDAAASSESTMPRLQLTPPAGMSTASGSDGGQPMLALGGYDQGGAAGIVNFAHGSARLSSSDLATLRGLAKEALERGMYMRVVGHASMRTRDMDPFEHALANFNVSVARANAVASALMEMGVPAEQLIVDAVGDTQPVYSEAMPSGEEGNRRTEIFLES